MKNKPLKYISFIFVLMTTLSACGQKGPLYIQENNEMPQVDYVFDQDNTEPATQTSPETKTKK